MKQVSNNSKWYRIESVNELIPGRQIAFTTIEDDKNTMLWNEGFTLISCLPNSKGKIELSLKTKEDVNLLIYLDEINSIYIYDI